MLHLLAQYARTHLGECPPGYRPKEVRWALVFDHNGGFSQVQELGDTTARRNRGREFPRCPNFTFSEMRAGGVIKSHFLVESLDVVTLFGPKAADEKTQQKHYYFIGLLKEASEVLPSLAKVAQALEKKATLETIQKSLTEHRAKPTEKCTIYIDGSFPVAEATWHDWWDRKRAEVMGTSPGGGADGETAGPSARSLLSGELVDPLPVHPKIRGLADVGGNTSGDALLSYKQESFCSFGFKQSANAAVSEEEASLYRAALDDLLRHHSERLVNAKVAYWFKERIEEGDDPFAFLRLGGETEELNAQQSARNLLQAIQTGKRPELLTNRYYALTLSGAAGRIVVRDWMEGNFPELLANVVAWFDDLEIIARDGQGAAPPPKFLAIIGALVRDLKDAPAPLISRMWRAAVRNEPLPYEALSLALERWRVGVLQDEPPNHARVGLMKAYHLRKHRPNGKESGMTVHLNENHPSAAYHCGRLLAVLAQLQRSALGDVGAGVVQRYYAAASATPALVLGRLVRTSQHHLNKLDGGLVHWYETKLGAIWSSLKDQVPAVLTPEEQSLFALGYYQQLADLKTKKNDN